MALPSANDNPHSSLRSEVVALMATDYAPDTLGHIPAVRRRVLQLLCPSSPEHAPFCLCILHTLHDALFGVLPATDASPAAALTHSAAADAILGFAGLPARGTVTKEQQVGLWCLVTWRSPGTLVPGSSHAWPS